MRDMKTVTPGRARIVHVETDLGIVNIHVNLTDRHGRRVVSVEMIPNQYAGEPSVTVDGGRFIEACPDPNDNPPENWTECGGCGSYHPAKFDGDCRDDYNRWPFSRKALEARA